MEEAIALHQQDENTSFIALQTTGGKVNANPANPDKDGKPQKEKTKRTNLKKRKIRKLKRYQRTKTRIRRHPKPLQQ